MKKLIYIGAVSFLFSCTKGGGNVYIEVSGYVEITDNPIKSTMGNKFFHWIVTKNNVLTTYYRCTPTADIGEYVVEANANLTLHAGQEIVLDRPIAL